MSILMIATVTFVFAISMVYVFARWVEAGLACMLAVQLCNVTFGLNATIVGGLHLNALDAVSACLLGASVIRFASSLRLLTAPRLLAAAYALLFAFSFIRGCDANGLPAAANEARGFVGPLVALLYFADAPADQRSVRRYARWYLLLAACLCVVAALAVAGLPIGVAAGTHSQIDDQRVLPSSAAAIIAVAGLLAFAHATYGVRRLSAFLWPALFLFTAIYLRHRTVWIMLLACVASFLFLDGKLFRWIAPMLLCCAAGIALVAFAADQPGIATQSEFAQSLTSTGTWQWRVNSWQELLSDTEETPLSLLAGKPMGGGWWRIDPDSHLLQTAPPHSEYVTEYLRVGVLGLVSILLFACRPLVVLLGVNTMRSSVRPCPAIWMAIALGALVYGAAYSIEPELYALLGIANAIASHAPVRGALLADRESTPAFPNCIGSQRAYP